MNIFFQTSDTSLSPQQEQIMANRMYGLDKFFSPDTQAYIDVKRTSPSHHADDLYYVSINIVDGGSFYFTESYGPTIHDAFYEAYREMFRTVRDHKSKSRTLLRKAKSRLKNVFKGGRNY